MKKHSALIKMVFLDRIEYPAEVFYQLTLALMPLAIAVYLWLAVYRGGRIIGSFNLPSMITYYVVVMFLGRLLGHPAFWIADMVEDGGLSAFLVKPFHFLRYVFVYTFTGRVVNLFMSLPVLAVVLLTLHRYLVLPPGQIFLILFILSGILSVAVFYLLGILLGLVSLWTLEIGSIFYFYDAALGFLGGAMLPLSFFPSAVSGVLTFLPFTYLYYFPTQIYLDQLLPAQIATGFLIGGSWVVALYLIVRLTFRAGLRRYSSFGN